MLIRMATLTVISVLITAACSPNHNTYVNPKPAGQQPQEGEPTTLGFEIVGTIFARNRCMDCHTEAKGNRGGINLETYAGTKALAGLVLSDMISGKMPIGGPKVSDADVQIIQAWFDAGAPETSDLPLPEPITGEEPGEEPPPITFAEVNAKIFTPMCVRCHSGFSDHATVTARLSGIQNAIDTNRMPLGGPAVPDDLKQLLADWVAQGAALE